MSAIKPFKNEMLKRNIITGQNVHSAVVSQRDLPNRIVGRELSS